ncbi:NinB/ Orf homologous recombination mediator [Vibrio phage K250 g1]
MAEVCLVKIDGTLRPYTPEDEKLVMSIANGEVLKMKYSVQRNLQFHKKLFSLFNLAYDYCKPSFSLVTAAERHGIYGFAKFLDDAAERQDELLKSMASEYIAKLEKDRLTRFGEPQPCKDAFRKEIMVKAGYYDLVSTPSGPVKVAVSLKFNRMDNQKFNDLYQACFNVIWTEVLNKVYESSEDAEAAVNNAMGQLLSFT